MIYIYVPRFELQVALITTELPAFMGPRHVILWTGLPLKARTTVVHKNNCAV